MMITHSLGVVREVASYVYVMYLGKVVESGLSTRCSRTLCTRTRELMNSVPRADHPPKTKLEAIEDRFRSRMTCPRAVRFGLAARKQPMSVWSVMLIS